MSIDFAPRVAAGVALLDSLDSEWVRKIDLPTLDVSSLGSCVLGQVYDDYSEGLVALGYEADDEQAAIEHGFSMSVREFEKLRAEMGAPAYGSPAVFAPLTEEWKKAISARLSSS